MQRRRFVAMAGTTAGIAVAGCIGGESNPKGSPENIVEAYVELGTKDPTRDEVATLLHSASPIDPKKRANRPTSEYDVGGMDKEITIAEKDLAASEIESQQTERYGFDMGSDSMSTVGDQNNALAEVKVDMDVDRNMDNMPEESKEAFDELTTFELAVFVAEENGDWLVVDDSANPFKELADALGSFNF